MYNIGIMDEQQIMVNMCDKLIELLKAARVDAVMSLRKAEQMVKEIDERIENVKDLRKQAQRYSR